MECGGLAAAFTVSTQPTNQPGAAATTVTRAPPKRKTRKRISSRAIIPRICGKSAVLQLQVQEDAHNERKQRQRLHKHQTQ
jgi:hypothetical protein